MRGVMPASMPNPTVGELPRSCRAKFQELQKSFLNLSRMIGMVKPRERNRWKIAS
jgi:hypothetical protein